jgi:hypothetical protein
MTPKAAFVAAMLAALGAGVATAAAPASWAAEPTALAGITLGRHFPAAGEIADCPLFEPFRRENLPDELCVDTRKEFSADAIALKHVPLGPVAGTGRVVLHDGLVHSIQVTFDRRHYGQVKAALVDRYGAAQARGVEESGETLSWSGARAAMSLREDSGDGKLAAFELRRSEGLH